MKHLRKCVVALLTVLCLFSMTACSKQEEQIEDHTPVRVGSLKGPTTLGILALMEDASKEESELNYSFTMAAAADEITPLLIKGELDIALVPANLAAVLYEKTGGQVCVIDINTLSVLYMVSADEEIHEVADLKGKTILLTGKGTTPDYSLQYLLSQNGIDGSDVTLEYKAEATEVAAALKENPMSIGLLPQPFVTSALLQNSELKVVLNVGEAWTEAEGSAGSQLVTGVTVVNKAFLEEHEEAVVQFAALQKDSVNRMNADPAYGAGLAVAQGIVGKEAIAEAAIPKCNLVCMTGEEMKQSLSAYLSILYSMNPASVGGKLPADDFYYLIGSDGE